MNSMPKLIPSSIDGITITSVHNVHNPITCVFGCLLTQSGIQIKQQMLAWLTQKYDLITVDQEPPGKYFEWPALHFAQQYSLATKKPVLYIHTKGAGNSTNIYNQSSVRNLWQFEFIGHYNEYLEWISNHNDGVMCPFIGNVNHFTWLNGFIANCGAWASIPTIEPSSNRLVFEALFEKANISYYGRILSNVNSHPSVESSYMINIINKVFTHPHP